MSPRDYWVVDGWDGNVFNMDLTLEEAKTKAVEAANDGNSEILILKKVGKVKAVFTVSLDKEVDNV